ncbi:tRNA threonylcarbamoyladenosine biosynthesis protein TsaB [hydrothermal vent metagenome]|uniref:tRNA threonylcarbamoyladenosine biosynthesis protein TsaB n=1 Tax=hydrothermal vent metagenome TaxID=652676 RepID=A0A3B0YQQ5_9ZZZZ
MPVSTLAALARGAHEHSGRANILAALDARMKEVYWGAYQFDAGAHAVLIGEEHVCSPDSVPVPEGKDWLGAGSGWDAYVGVLSVRCALLEPVCLSDWQPHAADVARLAVIQYQAGEAIPPEQASPVYLRDNVADKPASKV